MPKAPKRLHCKPNKSLQRRLICLTLSLAVHSILLLIFYHIKSDFRQQIVKQFSPEEVIFINNSIKPAHPRIVRVKPTPPKPRLLTKRVQKQLKIASIKRIKKTLHINKPNPTKVIAPKFKFVPKLAENTRHMAKPTVLAKPAFVMEKQVAYLNNENSIVLKNAQRPLNLPPTPNPMRRKNILKVPPKRIKVSKPTVTAYNEAISSPRYSYHSPAAPILKELLPIKPIPGYIIQPADKIEYIEPAAKNNLDTSFISPEEKEPPKIIHVKKTTPKVQIISSIARPDYNPGSTTRFPPRPYKDMTQTLKKMAQQRAFPGKKIWTRYLNNLILNHGSINAIAVDHDGTKWFGMKDGLISFKNGQWHYYTADDGIGGDTVYAITVDSNGDKWIGTDKGTAFFDGKNWRAYTPKDGLIGRHVRGIAIDRQGHKWFATKSGISKFDGKTWTGYTTRDGLIHNEVYAIAIDRQDNKWFATPKGVSCFDNKQWRSYTTQNSGLVSNMVYALAIDDSGDKWFGTDKGASRFDGTYWRTFNSKNGLSGNEVFAIGVNKYGEKWFGTNSGISRYNDFDWEQYGTRYVFAITSDDSGNQWFGTDKGVTELAVSE